MAFKEKPWRWSWSLVLMIIQSIDSELWWLANADEVRSQSGFSVHDVIQRMQEAFHFFAVPVAIPTGNDGYKFEQGSLRFDNGQIHIRQLIVYNAAIHLTVAGSTDGADKVFEKLVEVFSGLGVRQPTTPPTKFYRSTIICDFEKSIDSLIVGYARLVSIVQSKFRDPQQIEIRASGIAFMADATSLPPAISIYNPTLFTINRKTDVSFDVNRFTCFANMQTMDHVLALEEIETLIGQD
jgi:hypothetical protein